MVKEIKDLRVKKVLYELDIVRTNIGRAKYKVPPASLFSLKNEKDYVNELRKKLGKIYYSVSDFRNVLVKRYSK